MGSVETVASIFQSGVFVVFCYKFLTPKWGKIVNLLGVLGAIGVMYGTITFINSIYISFAYIEVVAYFAIMLPYVFIFLKGKWYMKIFTPLTGYVVNQIISFIMSQFVSGIFNRDITYVMTTQSVYRIAFLVIINLLYAFIMFVIYKMFSGDIKLKSRVEITFMILLPVMSLVVSVLAFAIMSDVNISDFDRLILGIIDFVVLLFTFSLYIIVTKLSNNYEMERSNLIMKKQQDIYKAEIEITNKYISDISTVKHNMTNKILCMEDLIKNNDLQDAKTICNDLKNELKTIGSVINTGNVFLDSILNVIYNKALENNVKMTVRVNADLKRIESYDLITLIGNLGDNCIDCLKGMPMDNRKMHIYIVQRGNYYIMEVSNTVLGPVTKNNKELKTSKSNSREHGYGLKTVKNIVEKYYGKITFIEENGKFVVKILI